MDLPRFMAVDIRYLQVLAIHEKQKTSQEIVMTLGTCEVQNLKLVGGFNHFDKY